LNNNLYHWQAEHMVRYEMSEVDRAVEQARLLREAGLAGPGWLTRAVKGLVNLLNARRKSLQERLSVEPTVFPEQSRRSV
jgi:hypothetical protein